jgi:hypothetical protein
MTSEEKAERLGYWKGQHQSWQASGLTQRAYCEREGLSFSMFDKWRRRARAVQVAGLATVAQKAASAATGPSPQMIKLIPAHMQTSNAACDIELRSPGGWQIRINTANSLETVLSLLRQLA